MDAGAAARALHTGGHEEEEDTGLDRTAALRAPTSARRLHRPNGLDRTPARRPGLEVRVAYDASEEDAAKARAVFAFGGSQLLLPDGRRPVPAGSHHFQQQDRT